MLLCQLANRKPHLHAFLAALTSFWMEGGYPGDAHEQAEIMLSSLTVGEMRSTVGHRMSMSRAGRSQQGT